MTWQQELAERRYAIVGFGEDHAGEMYLLDFVGGQIHRVGAGPAATTGPDFPRKLSETGLFASTKDHAAGTGADPVLGQRRRSGRTMRIKERFLAMPGDCQDRVRRHRVPQPAPGAPRGWRFPDGTVAVKTFSLEMEHGNPASRRRLETRILHFQQLAGTEEVGDQYWRGYTYIWNDEQTDAELLEAGGLDRDLHDQGPGRARRPAQADVALSQPGRMHAVPHDAGQVRAGRQHTADEQGPRLRRRVWPISSRRSNTWACSTSRCPSRRKSCRSWPTTTSEAGSQTAHRGYLHANCSHCHMKWGGGNAEFQLLATLDLDGMGSSACGPATAISASPTEAARAWRSRAVDDTASNGETWSGADAARRLVGGR